MVVQCFNNNNTIFVIAIGIVFILLVFSTQNKRQVEPFAGFLPNVGKFLKSINPFGFVRKIFGTLGNIFKKVGKFVLKIFKTLGNAFKKLLKSGIDKVFGGLKKMIKKTVNKITKKLKPFLTILGAGLVISAIGIIVGCLFYMGYDKSQTVSGQAAIASNNSVVEMPVQLPIGPLANSDFKSKLLNST